MAGPKALARKIRKRTRKGSRRGILPMNAFYGRDPKPESRRQQFYGTMATVYGFENWRQQPETEEAQDLKPGYGGRGRDLRKVTQKTAVEVNANCAPLEYMAEKGWLHSEELEEDQATAMIRFQAALRLRDLIEGSQISTLASPDMDRVGAGGNGLPINDTKVDCIKFLERIKTSCKDSIRLFGNAEPMAYDLISGIVGADLWVWEYWPSRMRRPRMRIVHYGFDCVSFEVGELSVDEFDRRWSLAS